MGLSSLGQQLIFPALASQIRGLRPTGLAESEGRGGQLEPGSAKRRGERRNGRGGLQFQRQIWSAGRPGEVSERASERATVWGKTFEVFSLEMGVVENGDDLSSLAGRGLRSHLGVGSSTYAG